MIPAPLVDRAQKFAAGIGTVLDVQVGRCHPRAGDALRRAQTRTGTFVLDGVELPVRANIGIHTQPISFIGLPVVAVRFRSSRCRSACRSSQHLGARTSPCASPMRWNAPAWWPRRRRGVLGWTSISRGAGRSDHAVRALREGAVANDVAVLDELFRQDDVPCATASAKISTAMCDHGVSRGALADGLDAQDRQDRDHDLWPRRRGRLTLFYRDSAPAGSDGRCRPGCGFRKAGRSSLPCQHHRRTAPLPDMVKEMSLDDLPAGAPTSRAETVVRRVDRASPFRQDHPRRELRLQLADEIVRGVLPPAPHSTRPTSPSAQCVAHAGARGAAPARGFRPGRCAGASRAVVPALDRTADRHVRGDGGLKRCARARRERMQPAERNRWRRSTRSCGC